MVEAIVDALSIMGYNLVIEGTLRTSEVPLKTARLLRDRGYSVSLALMAVKPEISLISCQLRYEQMRIAGTEPRAVDPAHHLSIVKSIVGNLKVLEESGMFDDIGLYSRSEQCLFSARTTKNRRAKRSSGSSSEHGPPKKALTTNISSNASNKQEPSASFLVRGRTSLRGR
ncbi:MAG: zeta toxin family protein [Eggerthella lenta]